VKRSNKRICNKGQLSLELIILLSVLLAGFAAVMILSNQSLSTARSKIYHDQAHVAVDILSEYASRVYLEGQGAKQTVQVRFPETLASAALDEDAIILSLHVRGGNIQPVYAHLPMSISGNLPQNPGRHTIVIERVEAGVVFS